MTNSPFNGVSPQAQAISHVFIISLVVLAFILVLVLGLVLFVMIKFRGREGEAEPPQIFGNKKLEITWTVVPGLILVFLFILTVIYANRSDPSVPKGRQPDLVVIAHQWWWELKYPQTGVVTANEIHMPVHKKWLVRIESADVIHSFWVPRLARKMDAIPGHPNHIWLESDSTGTYWGTCSEYCGAQHAGMHIRVIVQNQKDFDAWSNEQQQGPNIPQTGDAAKGQQLFDQLTCLNCHAIKNIGPNLTHVGSRETLASGVITNTPENMARWLHNPQAVKPGCNMPNLYLTNEQVKYLVAYLEASK